jgi:serine/threonine protein kinase
MTSASRFSELRSLFEQVCDLPRDQQREALANATGDTAMIAEVEALLAAETKSLHRAVVPVAALLGDLPETELDVGDRIGVWKLERKLAVGGMGAVYLAERADGHFQQQAAIKFLRGFPSAEALTRLAAERQILAGLQHPHIARLFDGGATPSGQPYLVMEYVEGVPIDRWCADQNLQLVARLRLFRNVCRAVAFAHQRLVVHCDLKPSNVLVRGDGAPVLLDFGIARALDRSREGAPEAFFTPGYASPEQMAGAPVTMASDVYSLGLILFELLTGRRARLDAEDRTVTQLGIAEVKPSDLANVAHCPWHARLAGDLDAIVLRATADRPGLRYATADALAEDIERYLDVRPVAARNQTLWYRYSKLLRRRWPLFAAGAAVVLLSALFTWRLVVARDRALAAEHEAVAQAAAAQQVSDFLVSVFQFANPEKNPQRREITAREVLDEGAKRIGTELAGQPRVRAQLTQVLGRAYWQVGRPNQALELYEESAKLWQSAAVNDPLQAARVLSDLATLQSNNHLTDQAIANAQTSLDLRRARLPEDDLALADSWNTLALTLSGANRFDEALVVYRRALDIRKRIEGPRSVGVANTLHDIALVDLQRHRPEDAVPVYREALAMKREIYGGDRHPDVLSTLENLARALGQSGHTEEAVALHKQAIEGRRALDGADSNHEGINYGELGYTLHDAGRFREAATNYLEAMRILEVAAGKDNPSYALEVNNLASAYDDMGDYAAAEPLFRQSLATRLKTLPPDDPMVSRAQANLARVLMRAGQLDESKVYLEAAFASRLKRVGVNGVEVAQTELMKAEWLRRHGDTQASQALLDELEAKTSKLSASIRAQRLRELARLAASDGKFAEALALYQQVRKLLTDAWGADHSLTASMTLELAATESALGQKQAAQRDFDRAAPVVAANFVDSSPERRQLQQLREALSAAH